jgi:ketosteroid isomerase-like protein
MSDQTRELNKLAEDWAAAELDGDTASLREILADDFVAVGPRGFVLSGEQWLNRHESGSLKYGSFGLNEAEIRTFGDAAIMVCRQTAAGVYEDENGRYDIDESFRATLVYVSRTEAGVWPVCNSVRSWAGRSPRIARRNGRRSRAEQDDD